MGHLSDLSLIELVAGRVPAGGRAAVEAHLAACPECAQRHAALAETWRILGEWPIPAGERDLAPAILAAAAGEGEDAAVRPVWRGRARAALRLAAAVLLSAAAGHLAGRLVFRKLAAPAATAQADESAVVEVLSLGALGEDCCAGLERAVLDVQLPVEEG